MRRDLGFIAILVAATGCVQGEAKYFPDESSKVQRIHVNAFAHDLGRDGALEGKVEVSGIGSEGEEHAFTGTVRVSLDLRDSTQAQHTYTRLKEWTVEVRADEFASATVPHYVFTIDSSTFPKREGYSVSANATIGGREIPWDGQPALFEWSPP